MGRAGRRAVVAAGAALAVAAVVVVAWQRPAPPPAEATAAVTRFVAALDDAVRASHLDPATGATDVLADALDDLLADDAARDAVVALGSSVDATARSVAALGVEEVHVALGGEPRTTRTDGDRVTVLVDVTTTRHVATDDVDWVEVVPHEVTVDTAGRLVDVVALDLEHAHAD